MSYHFAVSVGKSPSAAPVVAQPVYAATTPVYAATAPPSSPAVFAPPRPPAMETFDALGHICPAGVCWPMLPCILCRAWSKYEEKKSWNVQRRGEDFDECLYFKKSWLCCCVLCCNCCCATCCSCIWISDKERQKKADEAALLNIAKLEGSMGIAASKETMTPKQYEAYLRAKKKEIEDAAAKAASIPPPSRSIRDIKLMIVQSMVENGNTTDALQVLKELDTVNDAEIEKYREETPTSLRTKGLQLVAGVLTIAGAFIPVAGAAGAGVGVLANFSKANDKENAAKAAAAARAAQAPTASPIPIQANQEHFATQNPMQSPPAVQLMSVPTNNIA